MECWSCLSRWPEQERGELCQDPGNFLSQFRASHSTLPVRVSCFIIYPWDLKWRGTQSRTLWYFIKMKIPHYLTCFIDKKIDMSVLRWTSISRTRNVFWVHARWSYILPIIAIRHTSSLSPSENEPSRATGMLVADKIKIYISSN